MLYYEDNIHDMIVSTNKALPHNKNLQGHRSQIDVEDVWPVEDYWNSSSFKLNW